MYEEEIQSECSSEEEKELRREEQKEVDEVLRKLTDSKLNFNEIIEKRKSAGIIKQFKWIWSGDCFCCNKKVSKGSTGYKAGLDAHEWFCSLECVEKALDTNLCNCRSYLCLEDRSSFLEQIETLKKATLKAE